MKVVKLIGIVVAALVALFISALLVLTLLIDPNDYKDEIADAAKQATGRELTFGGDLSWTLFPRLGVELGAVRVGNAPGFGPEPFAKVEAARLNLRLLPLLWGNVELGALYLEGLQLNLTTDAAGANNWSDLVSTDTETDARRADTPRAAPITALAVGGIRVRDAGLTWDNRQSGEHYAIRNLALETGPITLVDPVAVELTFDAQSAAPPLDAHVTFSTRALPDIVTQRHRLEDLQLGLDLTGPDLPAAGLALRVKGQVALDLEQGTLDAPGLRVDLAGLTLTGAARGQGLNDAPVLNADFELAGFDPRAWLARQGMEAPVTADPQVLKTAAASFSITATPTVVRIRPLRVAVDATRLEGAIGVTDLEQPVLDFELVANEIDLDRYLPPETEQAAPAAAAVAAPALLPVEAVRAIDLDGSLRIDRLKISGLSLTDVRLPARARNGLLELAPITATLYGGKAEGVIRVNARDQRPAVVIEQRLSTVQAGPLVRDLLDADLLSGIANLDARLAFEGNTEAEARHSLQGRIALNMDNTVLKRGDIEAMVLKALAPKLPGAQAEQAPADARQTQLTELHGTITITNGIAQNTDFSAQSRRLGLTGRGSADLVNETLDYRVFATLPPERAPALRGVPVPIHIRGAMLAPSVSVETDEVLKAILKAETRGPAEQRRSEVIEQIQGREQEVQEKLEQKLKELIKR